MLQANSPGLPPWPRLLFYRKNSRALVKARHATWRSFECACYATELVICVINISVACSAWMVFSTPNVALRMFFVFMAVIICFPLTALAARSSLREPLARILFATTTTFWVTEDSIIFKSRLYSSPVVVWRKWGGKPVGVTLIVEPDTDALRYITDSPTKRKWPETPINEASVIKIVIASPSKFDGAMPTTGENLQRSIPISEVSGQLAAKFVTVFTAAAMLVPLEDQNPTKRRTQGVDIDAAI